jgi:hypothetical protein
VKSSHAKASEMSRLFCIFIAATACLGCHTQAGIEATVTNIDSEPIHEVSVVVTGARHKLGTIEPGESASVHLAPQGASALAIEAGEAGEQWDVNAYLEPGYHGKIHVMLESHGVTHVEKDLRLGGRAIP